MDIRKDYKLFVAIILTFIVILASFTQVTFAQTVNGFTVAYGGRTYDSAANRTTFTYIVTGTNVPPDLSHFDIEIPTCPIPLVVAAYSPTNAVSFGVDPTTGVNGIKWDEPLQMSASRTYSITFEGNVVEGTVTAAVKGGNGFATTLIAGPSCTIVSVNVEKYLSTDGVTWQDADAAPGPFVTPGTQVSFRFVVTNTGNVDLTTLTLTDSVFDLSVCTLPAALPPGAFFECVIGPVAAVDGQHTNVATVSGVYDVITVSDTDSANYFSGIHTPTPTPTVTPVTVTPTFTPNPGDLPITIVIEGPVQAININIITIYNINIQLADDDPNLTIIQVGDIVRVAGNTQTMNNTIIIVAVNVVIINVDINVDTGEQWRDEGDCANPPPPWAPAHGWRRRCEGNGGNITIIIGDESSGSGSGSGSGGMGMGMGMGG